MKLLYYDVGLISGIYLMLAIFFLGTRRHQAPYRTVFGCTMLLGFIVVTIESLLINFGQPFYSTNTEVCLDMLAYPLYMLEVECIVNQDLDALPWNKRLKSLSYLYVPILILLVWSFFMEKDDINIVIAVAYVTYALLHLGYMLLHLTHFQQLLPANMTRWHRANWAWFLFPLFFLHYLSYIFFSDTVNIAYTFLLFALTQIMHGVLIYHQRPVDTSSMYAHELEEQQRAALDEFKNVADKLKMRMGIEEHIKAFDLQHPGFEQKLRSMTANKLTKRDVYLCILIHEGLKSSEIASQLAISTSSVEVARYRLRDKLNLDKGANLANELRKLTSNLA